MDYEGALIRRAEARVGSVLRGKWSLDGLLGVGGMAAVYGATHRNGKRGAVKMLHLELSADPDARGRFLREGYVANQVDHPGAVSVLDDDVAEDGAVFLVMELLEGTTAEAMALSRSVQRLDIPEVLRIADQVLDVLVAAHKKGIVHRDLKPENIFITRDGRVKVLDFGIARLRDLPAGSKATRTGTTLGTPAFMPPEQALGNTDQIDGRTDLWALGATMFSLLTGRQVHEADTLNKLLLAAMTMAPRPIRSVMPGLPPDVAQLVDRALAFHSTDRFPDAQAMQQALRALGGPPQPAVALPELSTAATVPFPQSQRLPDRASQLRQARQSDAMLEPYRQPLPSTPHAAPRPPLPSTPHAAPQQPATPQLTPHGAAPPHGPVYGPSPASQPGQPPQNRSGQVVVASSSIRMTGSPVSRDPMEVRPARGGAAVVGGAIAGVAVVLLLAFALLGRSDGAAADGGAAPEATEATPSPASAGPVTMVPEPEPSAASSAEVAPADAADAGADAAPPTTTKPVRPSGHKRRDPLGKW